MKEKPSRRTHSLIVRRFFTFLRQGSFKLRQISSIFMAVGLDKENFMFLRRRFNFSRHGSNILRRTVSLQDDLDDSELSSVDTEG